MTAIPALNSRRPALLSDRLIGLFRFDTRGHRNLEVALDARQTLTGIG